MVSHNNNCHKNMNHTAQAQLFKFSTDFSWEKLLRFLKYTTITVFPFKTMLPYPLGASGCTASCSLGQNTRVKLLATWAAQNASWGCDCVATDAHLNWVQAVLRHLWGYRSNCWYNLPLNVGETQSSNKILAEIVKSSLYRRGFSFEFWFLTPLKE